MSINTGAAGKIIGSGKLKDGDRVGGDVVAVNVDPASFATDGFELTVPQTALDGERQAPVGAIPRKTNQTILDESDCPVQFWGYHPAVAVETTQDIAIGDLLYRSDGDDYLVTEATQPSLASLTDSSGGTAATTLPAIGATYDQDEVRHSVASLNAKIDDVLQVLRSVGIALEARTDNDEGNIAVFLKGL